MPCIPIGHVGVLDATGGQISPRGLELRGEALQAVAGTRVKALAPRRPQPDSLPPYFVLRQLATAKRVCVENGHQTLAFRLRRDRPVDLRARARASGNRLQMPDSKLPAVSNKRVAIVIAQCDPA